MIQKTLLFWTNVIFQNRKLTDGVVHFCSIFRCKLYITSPIALCRTLHIKQKVEPKSYQFVVVVRILGVLEEHVKLVLGYQRSATIGQQNALNQFAKVLNCFGARKRVLKQEWCSQLKALLKSLASYKVVQFNDRNLVEHVLYNKIAFA